jgi:hypothetical protein
MSLARLNMLSLVALAMLGLSVYSQGADVKVNCNKNHATISAALKLLNPAEANTVTVSGHCKENIRVQSFDRLTLISKSGATIDDKSKGTNTVVYIADSRRVFLQGFTINGGTTGVYCASASVCHLTANTIQSSVGEGVVVDLGSSLFSNTNVIQNNAEGLRLAFSDAISGGDTLQGNSGPGIGVGAGRFYCLGSTIRNNGWGIIGSGNSGLRIESCTISGNASDGVQLGASAEGNFAGSNVITGNAGDGVNLGDLSFGSFEPGGQVTGNLSGVDVACNPQFSATRGALTNIGGGITNCTEPAKRSALGKASE